jgi:hypothetical protein
MNKKQYWEKVKKSNKKNYYERVIKLRQKLNRDPVFRKWLKDKKPTGKGVNRGVAKLSETSFGTFI